MERLQGTVNNILTPFITERNQYPMEKKVASKLNM